MKSCYKERLFQIFFIAILLFGLFSSVHAVPYTVWGYVHNSDGSAPTTGDITITAYLQKNPSGTYIFSNINNGFTFNLEDDALWGYDPNGTGGPTTANPGDLLVLNFANTNSGSPYFGETGQIIDAIGTGTETPQQFGANDFSLPVELSSFQAKIQSNQVVLSWTTQAELNNLGFNIYKSISGQSEFQLNAIIINGAGTSTSSHSYEYIDANVKAGESYTYSLESVDINGQKYKHQSISITVDDNTTPDKHELLQNFPQSFQSFNPDQIQIGC